VAGVCSTSKHPGLWVSRLGSLIEKKEKERKTEKLAGEGGRECVWEGVFRRSKLKKENQEKKEKQRKTSPGDPGVPGVDPESPVSLGSQNPKESLLGRIHKKEEGGVKQVQAKQDSEQE